MKKISRRKFVQVAALTTLLPLPEPAKTMFIHHVYFWLNRPDSAEDRQQLLNALQVLSKVPVIQSAHIGVPASTHREVVDRSYQVSWLLFFKNLEDEETYQKHPVHLKFVEENKHLWTKVVVYDSIPA